MKRAVVVGAGIGGLVTAAVLARAGLEVTVLEAQVYPGGCASSYFHQGYRFDTGATLAAGFYPSGPMDQVSQATGIRTWPVRPADAAMAVYLPDGAKITRWTGEQRWDEYRAAFGARSLEFFRWQERTAGALWSLALRLPPWPPQSPGDALEALQLGLPWLLSRDTSPRRQIPALAVDAFRPLAPHLRGLPEALKWFVDAQLLISAQATSENANALYGAAALDLPRRGVVHMQGGMGAIAEALVDGIRQHGGNVRYRQEVTRIRMERDLPVAVETKRGDSHPADVIVSNLTPWNTAELFEDHSIDGLRHRSARPDGWGAFMVYVGFDGSIISENFPLHHQVVSRYPMGNGNTIFASLSPAWDASRAPHGQRALTLSTHTALEDWWQLYDYDRASYIARKADLVSRVMTAAETALPGLREAARLVISGTPVTFERFTRRKWGWVGGFPQTHLMRSFGPRLGHSLWMVGDSIFPGQSTAAVALGGLRVAKRILHECGVTSLSGASDTDPQLRSSV